MKTLRTTSACLLTVALAACQTTTIARIDDPTSASIPVAYDPSPGPRLITADKVASLASEVCIEPAPTNAHSENVLANLGFVKNRFRSDNEQQMYVHPSDAVSVFVYSDDPGNYECIVVFESNEDTKALGQQLSQLNTPTTDARYVPPDTDEVHALVVKAR